VGQERDHRAQILAGSEPTYQPLAAGQNFGEGQAERAVTVVYDTRDEQHTDAAVIRNEIARRLRTRTARYARRGAA